MHQECLSIESLVQHILHSVYPASYSIHLAKVIVLPTQLVHDIKQATMTETELAGVNYFFWCWLYRDEPSEPAEFLFGQITILHTDISWDLRTANFLRWARRAYTRGWFDMLDMRAVPITYLQQAEQR